MHDSPRARLARTAAVLTAPLLVLPACGAAADGDDGVTVLTSAYPFTFVAERVAGDLATVENVTAPGVDPHDVELTGRQVAAFGSADVIVYTESFQPAVDAAVEQADRDAGVVELGEVVGLLEGDEEHDHEGEEHSDEEGHSDEDHEGHDHGGVDPHFWLDPSRMASAAEAVRDALVSADADNADTYQANAASLVAELETLDEDYTAGLATCERRSIVTSHEAFAYLADTYDLQQYPIAGLNPSDEPTGAQLAAITDLVEDQGITTVFTEELVSAAIADTVASATGARTATLDPIEGLSDETADDDYLTIMERNLDAVREANGCS
ncbi:metal ABC transporter substrate-binding protein [Aeromicrobium marinum]|nr:zinc ABC transporter substrate-binding protein [Aeromicrobium marinum]